MGDRAEPMSSPVSRRLLGCKLEFCQRLPANTLTPTTISLAPILNDAFSKPHICDCLYCAFPRNHLGAIWETGRGGGVHDGSHQSLSDARHFPIDLRFKHSLPSADIGTSTDSRTKIFSPKLPLPCSCWRPRNTFL